MDATVVLAAVAVGLAAGLVSGLFGVGGGILLVPGLVLFLGQDHLEAEATSLLAIVPVALVGALSQRRYGNLRAREGIGLGLLATGGAIAGVVLANVLPERGLEVAFAGLLLLTAVQLVRRAATPRPAGAAQAPRRPAARRGDRGSR